MEYSSDQLYSSSIGAVTKHYLQELRAAQLLFDNPEYLAIWHLCDPVDARLNEFHYQVIPIIMKHIKNCYDDGNDDNCTNSAGL